MSYQSTHTTGWSSSCRKPGFRQFRPYTLFHFPLLSTLQESSARWPVARTNAANCARVTSYLPMANGRWIRTRCRGLSRAASSSEMPVRVASVSVDPMVKLPAGRITISGHSGQSLNDVPGTTRYTPATGRTGDVSAAVRAGVGAAAGFHRVGQASVMIR